MRLALQLWLLFAVTARAAEPMCGTSPENDLRVRRIHERTRARIASLATESTRTATLREGAFYLQNDDTITPGYRPFDLAGQSLVFTPAGDAAYTMRREPLQYVETFNQPRRDFQTETGYLGWHYMGLDLPFAFPLFGQSVSRIFITAFNSIHIYTPGEEKGTHFDAIEAAVHRTPVLSPLMITTSKPRALDYPRVYIDMRPDAVIITWRSTANAPFGYDIQTKLASDGTVTYSYRSLLGMRWGTPVLSAGFDPQHVSRTALNAVQDNANDVTTDVPALFRPMLDTRRVDVERLADSDLFAIRITLAGPIDRTQLADGQVLGYEATIGNETAAVEIDRVNTRVVSFTGLRYENDGASVNINGNVVEIYGVQRIPAEVSARVVTFFRPLTRIIDSSFVSIPYTPPGRSIASDLSAVDQDAQLPVPIAEPFVLGAFDPYRVWDLVQTSYGLSNFEYDGVAMYQTYFTDMIFYAGAYATGGNPQVDGIAQFSPGYGSHNTRSPTLLHMNQLTYGYSAAEQTASKVMLHEFGHRWLYFFTIAENGGAMRSLNPVSAHPAAYVHTPAAFTVYGSDESSVMGGAFFTPQTDGSYRAHAANMGYSWTDLYLMGLAATSEVPPWFYLAGTDLPREYWPQEGAVAFGEKRNVQVNQITAVHGARIPSTALSQRQFRVAFVLVTEDGVEATDAEVAKLNEWRMLMERNFAIATGGRGRLVTTFVRPEKRRATR